MILLKYVIIISVCDLIISFFVFKNSSFLLSKVNPVRDTVEPVQIPIIYNLLVQKILSWLFFDPIKIMLAVVFMHKPHLFTRFYVFFLFSSVIIVNIFSNKNQSKIQVETKERWWKMTSIDYCLHRKSSGLLHIVFCVLMLIRREKRRKKRRRRRIIFFFFFSIQIIIRKYYSIQKVSTPELSFVCLKILYREKSNWGKHN